MATSRHSKCFPGRRDRAMRLSLLLLLTLPPGFLIGQQPQNAWSGYAHDARHTAVSTAAAQPLSRIHWSTPVDLNPGAVSGDLYIHYGSPAVTAANTVLIPVKTGAADGFEIQARSGATGDLLYTLSTDYTLPAHNWTPSYGLVLSTRLAGSLPGRIPENVFESTAALRVRPPAARLTERLYYPGAGGTVYYRDDVDSRTGPAGQIAFYGNALYAASPAALNAGVEISTPITADSSGNIFFGFTVQGSNPAALV